MIYLFRLIILVLALANPLLGWTADVSATVPPISASSVALVSSVAAAPTASTNTATQRPSRVELALFAIGLIGAVYKPGGDNPAVGMDCSGFVRYVYHEVAGLKLPHSARALSKIRNTIAKADLKPGDLVFFNTMKHAFSHVGIYLGDNQFVHAASSKTGFVMVSNLDEAYWAKRYEGARRILPSASAASPPITPATNTAPTDSIASFAQ